MPSQPPSSSTPGFGMEAEAYAQETFDRFGRRLIALARTRLDTLTRTKVDPEDVVQSAFRSFFVREANGQFQIESWDDLWRILVVITVRKCHRQVGTFRRQRRDVRREAVPRSDNEDFVPMADVAGREPTPDEVAILIETVGRLLDGAEQVERDILIMRLEGYSPPEIAERVGGISERKVYRVLAQAKKRLSEELA